MFMKTRWSFRPRKKIFNFNLLFPYVKSNYFKKKGSEAEQFPIYCEITIPSLLYQTFQLLAK